MTTKMEIGAPMASAYLLEQPDHYTSHKFKPFYWMPFGSYAAFSVVSDYTLTPDFYDDITVYDWMRCAHKEKGQVKLPPPDKDDERQVDLEGEQDFSEYDTEDEGHGTASPDPTAPLTPQEPLVPNFVGGAIPRSDKGDHEYYCATMLTLFKPWRTGFDLKKHSKTWTEAFTSYTFTD
ncbi:hypothetical protein K439DRAFT_1645745 [Ramaria rubella]|nr:hypothetical protein K439DRAFT_1645745 [Ramaria rubella]